MDYLSKMDECLAIARKHNNKYMEQNILKAIQEYKKRQQ